jgi:hypothetical protein
MNDRELVTPGEDFEVQGLPRPEQESKRVE